MQKRVGRQGVVFNCYKFRTMRPDAEADIGATWAADNDPRITGWEISFAARGWTRFRSFGTS